MGGEWRQRLWGPPVSAAERADAYQLFRTVNLIGAVACVVVFCVYLVIGASVAAWCTLGEACSSPRTARSPRPRASSSA
jgi:hypothetical protein